MVAGRDETLFKPRRPSAPKLFLDKRVVPLAVNAAGWCEVTLDRASVRTGVRPAVILAAGMGVLSLMLLGLKRRLR